MRVRTFLVGLGLFFVGGGRQAEDRHNAAVHFRSEEGSVRGSAEHVFARMSAARKYLIQRWDNGPRGDSGGSESGKELVLKHVRYNLGVIVHLEFFKNVSSVRTYCFDTE